MTGAGFTKNGDGLWEKDGATVNATINGFEGIHCDIVPVLVEMLRKGGFDASVNFGTDAFQNMADGKPGLYMYGHGASLIDPYAAFELFNGRFSAPIGTTAGGNHLSRFKNPDYDKIIDAMAPLASDDPKFTDLAAQALGDLLAGYASTSRSSSGCTASPTTRPTGPTIQPKPIRASVVTAPSGTTPACS